MTTSDKDWKLPDVGEALSREHDRTVRHSLQLDVEFYKELLEDADLDDAQKEQVIGALWKIIVAFVELGFVEKAEQSTIMQAFCVKMG